MLGVKFMKIDVAGLKIDAITKAELLEQIKQRVLAKQKTFVTTPYSEFLYAGLRSKETRALLNSADFSIPDGIGILWAHVFMTQPFTFSNFYLKILQAWCQVVWTGASILMKPSRIYKDIPEKIVGADLAWDLAELAAKNNFSIYLLGARGEIAKKVADKFINKFPNIKIAGTSNKDISDPSIFSDITKAAPDIIFVAFSRLSSEAWIKENLKDLPASLAIGLGGTFDYIAGAKIAPPKFIRAIGLEWLYRLITQPSRLKRIIDATWGLVLGLVRYKVWTSTPLRKNGVAVVVNKFGKILLCRRVPAPAKHGGDPHVILNDYWQFPQGGLDEGEDPLEGTKRELFEETSIKSLELIKVADYINSYEWNNANRPFITNRFKHRGQEQITAILKFIGSDEEIHLDQRELIDYKWVNSQDVDKIIAPDRRRHAEIILAELAEIQL